MIIRIVVFKIFSIVIARSDFVRGKKKHNLIGHSGKDLKLQGLKDLTKEYILLPVLNVRRDNLHEFNVS